MVEKFSCTKSSYCACVCAMEGPAGVPEDTRAGTGMRQGSWAKQRQNSSALQKKTLLIPHKMQNIETLQHHTHLESLSESHEWMSCPGQALWAFGALAPCSEAPLHFSESITSPATSPLSNFWQATRHRPVQSPTDWATAANTSR